MTFVAVLRISDVIARRDRWLLVPNALSEISAIVGPIGCVDARAQWKFKDAPIRQLQVQLSDDCVIRNVFSERKIG